MTIQPATADQMPTLRDVRDRAAQAGCRAVYSAAQLAAWLARPLPEKMAKLIALDCVRIAVADGETIGYGALDPTSCEIEAVFVLPEYAGRGIGRVLLTALEAIAAAKGIASLRLSASLNAVNFYRSAGYVETTRGEFALIDGLSLTYVGMLRALEDPAIG